MLRSACYNTRISRQVVGRTGQRFSSNCSRHANTGHGKYIGCVIATTAVVASGSFWYCAQFSSVHNDASSKVASTDPRSLGGKVAQIVDDSLSSFVWGSNKTHILLPGTQSLESVKTPADADWLRGVALRDLSLQERHAACVDAKGDVYQWGDGFFGEAVQGEAGSSSLSSKPLLTLRGKNIVGLQTTRTRVFALSASGRIYVLSASHSKQDLPAGAPTPSSTPWWGTGWFWGEEEDVAFSEVTPQEKLGYNEKFVSMSAGQDHLLALTSTGRTFAHPINLNANAYGQLGIRKVDVPEPAASSSTHSSPRRSLDLTPKALLDPFAKSTPAIRRVSSETSPKQVDATLAGLDDGSIKFSDRLFEIPSLKGVQVSKIVAGGRTSFVKTSSGSVLGWGANEFGQIGLGGTVVLDTISVPTEVALWRSTPTGTRTTCLDVFAGGDLTFFEVDRVDGSAIPYVDVLSCGNGQWGGLGNALYSNAQGTPVRARNVSGLLEHSEKTNSLQPIRPHNISVSPTGHVLLTLDTLAQSGPGAGGRDLYAWGANQEYQLGNGKRGSLASPTAVSAIDEDLERFILKRRNAEVKDLGGKTWKRNVEVEQRAVAGYGNSIVYWRICS